MKAKYTKEDLLIPELRIDEEGMIEIYYAPHNEYINTKAKVVIVGITPGFEQMSTAIVTARMGLEEGKPIETIQRECKVAARFSGSLRKNIISMLDILEFGEVLNLSSCSELFEKHDALLHTISLIPYPVFIKGQNYTGHTPKLIKNKLLMRYVKNSFVSQINQLENRDNMLIIPLGKAVEETLTFLQEENALQNISILKGFPHPSGANVNRLIQLEANKEEMKNFIRNQAF